MLQLREKEIFETLKRIKKFKFVILGGYAVNAYTLPRFSADWVFDNSEIRTLRGKTITEELKLKIIDLDALFVLKFVSCRLTDIRDIFMLAPNIKNKEWVKEEILKKYDFNNLFLKVKEKIISKQFKDSLQGVY